MGHTNYPLVVFDQEPPHMTTPQEDVVSSICDGIRCLVGSRKLEPSSQWYPPPLLDAVPNIPGLLEERVSVNHILDPGNSDRDTNGSRSNRDGKIEDQQTYGNVRSLLGKLGIISFAAMSLVALVRIFIGNRQSSAPAQPVISPEPIVSVIDKEKPISTSLLLSAAPIAASDIHPIVMAPSHEPDPTPPPKPEGPTPRAEEPRPILRPPAVEIIGDPEDGDESDKEGPLDVPRRKGPRRRKRGKKKKLDTLGPGAEQDEDDVMVKDVPDEIPVAPLTPASHKTSPSSSLIVSDTVLGA